MFGLSRRRHHREPEDDMTPARRERIAILGVAGSTDLVDRAEAETHLLFARDLVERGLLGKDDRDDR